MLDSLTNTFGGLKKTGGGIISSDTPLQTAINKITSTIISPEDASFDGFKLDALQEESFTLKVEYSREVLDSGTVITQHSVIQPIVITLRGVVANKVLSTPKATENIQTEVNTRITQLERYTGGITGNLLSQANQGASFVKGAIGYVDQASVFLKDTVGIFKDFFPAGTAPITKFKIQMDALARARKPMKITSLGVVYNNLRITDFNVKQNNENGLLEVFLEFTEVFYTDLNYASVKKRTITNALKHTSSNVENKGITEGNKRNISSLKLAKNSLL